MAEITRCAHRETHVVIPHGSGEVIARICADCLDPLPANWGCQECEWMEISEMSGSRFVISSLPCDNHRHLEGT